MKNMFLIFWQIENPMDVSDFKLSRNKIFVVEIFITLSKIYLIFSIIIMYFI